MELSFFGIILLLALAILINKTLIMYLSINLIYRWLWSLIFFSLQNSQMVSNMEDQSVSVYHVTNVD